MVDMRTETWFTRDMTKTAKTIGTMKSASELLTFGLVWGERIMCNYKSDGAMCFTARFGGLNQYGDIFLWEVPMPHDNIIPVDSTDFRWSPCR